MNRRHFLKGSLSLGLLTSLPVWGRPLLAPATTPLAIPSLLDATSSTNSLILQTGQMTWRSGTKTKTWGINGALLGPAIRLKRNQTAHLRIHNRLPETSTLHWHGLVIPGAADGGPHAMIAPGSKYDTVFTVDQPAATCWFHPHPHQRSGYHVAMGLGGLLIIEDEESAHLPLPKTWGVDDIPVILQDKRLNTNNQIDYEMDVLNAAIGWFGELMLTNGAVYPQHSAPRGWLRLRLLNGCNARSLHLSTSDKRPMYVIASDGGFLAEPIKVTELPLLMGERFEVLINTEDGKAFDLVTLPVIQMGMTLSPFEQALAVLHIQPEQRVGTGQLPDHLTNLPALPDTTHLPKRTLTLSMDPSLDAQGMQALMERYGHEAMAGMGMDDHSPQSHAQHGTQPHTTSHTLDIYHANFINGKAFDMKQPAFAVKQGQLEKWIISGEGDMMLHPFHIHGTQFRILRENGETPAPHRQGWKDIVKVEGSTSEVLVRFPHTAAFDHPYMAHCHLLEHEDTGMMLSFTVTA